MGKVYNFRSMPLTNVDTLLAGPNPRRVRMIFSNAQNIYWVNFWGAAGTRVGMFVPAESSGSGPVIFGTGDLNTFVSQEARAILNVAGPNTINFVEEIEE